MRREADVGSGSAGAVRSSDGRAGGRGGTVGALAARPRARLRRAPFQVDLSRALAGGATRPARLLRVVHQRQGPFRGGRRGRPVDRGGARRECFAATSCSRISQEAAYGRRFAKVAATFGPDVIVACNVPLVAKSVTAAWCRREGRPLGSAAGPATARP